MKQHSRIAASIGALVAAVTAQEACTLTAETRPSLSWQSCASGGACTTNTGSVVIDANWRWLHTVDGYDNCYTGNEWDTSICDTNAACAEACCLDGADYASTYGITASGSALSLKFVTQGSSATNIGSRTYLMASDTEYEMFTLLGNEFTFDVDVSNLPCGLNGALYFVSMYEDGGLSEYEGNNAGAEYGTGYCDSQCPRDLKFINGEANVEGWEPSSNDNNAGIGDHGACCPEMDIWEANSISTALTPHPCTNITQTECEGDACGGTYSGDDNRYKSECDPDGCDFNPYRQGVTDFYGAGLTVDTSRTFTVVTQFLESDDGTLGEIRRYYVQDGAVIGNPASTAAGVAGYDSITDAYCDAQKTAFGDTTSFQDKGGLAQMGRALANGMVLVMSLWDDHYANMLWLDSTYPVDSTAEGAARGTCATSSGVPADVEANSPDASVVYSNIKFGPINSTFSSGSGSGDGGSGGGSTTTTLQTSTRTSTSSSATGTAVPQYGQCGGLGYTGSTTCASGYTCTYSNDYYSQCL